MNEATTTLTRADTQEGLEATLALNRLPCTQRDPDRIGAIDPLIVGRPSVVSSVGDDQLASSHS